MLRLLGAGAFVFFGASVAIAAGTMIGQADSDRPGGDYMSLPTPDAAACATQCATDGLCLAWSYHAKDENSCTLKAVLTPIQRMSGATSGVAARAERFAMLVGAELPVVATPEPPKAAPTPTPSPISPPLAPLTMANITPPAAPIAAAAPAVTAPPPEPLAAIDYVGPLPDLRGVVEDLRALNTALAETNFDETPTIALALESPPPAERAALSARIRPATQLASTTLEITPPATPLDRVESAPAARSAIASITGLNITLATTTLVTSPPPVALVLETPALEHRDAIAAAAAPKIDPATATIVAPPEEPMMALAFGAPAPSQRNAIGVLIAPRLALATTIFETAPEIPTEKLALEPAGPPARHEIYALSAPRLQLASTSFEITPPPVEALSLAPSRAVARAEIASLPLPRTHIETTRLQSSPSALAVAEFRPPPPKADELAGGPESTAAPQPTAPAPAPASSIATKLIAELSAPADNPNAATGDELLGGPGDGP